MDNDKYVEKLEELYKLALEEKDTRLAFEIAAEIRAQGIQNDNST